MSKELSKLAIRFVIINLFLFCEQLKAFTFLPPTINVNPLTINTLSTYTFVINRNYDITLQTTPWNTQLVPAGSKIDIIFPSQFILNSSSLPSINILQINDVTVNNNISLTLSGTQTLIISNAILTSSAISNVTIILNNVLNPSPAITTGSFFIQIGNDISSNSTGVATVTLESGTFDFCQISFSPSYVNSSSAMLLNITPNNKIPISGLITITFPSSLQWSQDVSTNHQLLLDSISTCKVTSTQISTINCSGMTSTQIIQFSFSSFNNISYITQNILIQIDGLFSPPTTSPPDILTIGSYSSGGYQIDQCHSTIKGLTPKKLSLVITPSANPMYINSFTGLNFSFTTLDTIIKTDYFTISFPLNSSIVYTFKVSNFLLGTVTYTIANNTLTFLQLSSSSTKYSNTASYIMFLNYKAPLTTKTTTSITLTVWNSNGHKKMQGSNTLTAVQKQYQIINVITSNYTINSIATYSLTLNISDTILSNGMLSIQLPPELKSIQTGNLSVCPTITNGTSNITCSFGTNQRVIILKNIFNNFSSMPIIITVNLYNLLNIYYQTQISAFVVNLYYDTDQQNLVATYTQNLTSNPIKIVASKLNQTLIFVKLNNYKLLIQNVSYMINFTIQNSIPANGFILIQLPQNSLIKNNVASCSVSLNTTTYNLSCSYINSTDFLSNQVFKVKIEINSLTLKAGDLILVKINSCCVNPSKTRPLKLNQITTYTSNSNLIQYFYSSLSSSVYTDQFVQVDESQMSLYRSSTKNDDLTTVYISFTQPQQLDQSGSYLLINFDTLSTVYFHNFFDSNFSPTCSIISNSANISTFQVANCNLLSLSSIKVSFPLIFVQTNNLLTLISFQCNISITLFKNPPSFAPIKISLTVETLDSYLYSSGYFFIQNAIASSFSSINYEFTSRIYETTTNLTINITDINLDITQSIKVSQLAQYLTKGTSNFDCLTNKASVAWSFLNGNNQLKISFLNASQVFQNSLTFQLINLYVPLTNLTNLNIQTYQQSYMISQYNQIFFSTVCNMPCKECPSIQQPNFCISCFLSPSISQNKLLFNNTCLKTCPVGTYSYIASVYYQYICQICNQTCYTCDRLADNCTSCNNSLSSTYPYFYQNLCLSKCPDSTFANITNLQSTCQKCVYPCASCQNQSQCTTCQSNLILYNNQCISSCPPNITVININFTQCLNCAKQCKTCQNQTTICITCFSNGSNLYVPSLKTCVKICPITTVLDTTFTKCVICKQPCQSCAVVQTNCTSCSNNTFLSQITEGICLNTCEQFYFANLSNNQCQLCSSVINCRNCSSETICLSCDGGMGYVYFPPNMSCLFTTPQGYVNLSGIAQPCEGNCTECIQTPIKCTKCSGIYFLDSNTNECVNQCPLQFVGINNKCIECEKPCLQCLGTKTNCTKCISFYYLLITLDFTLIESKCYIQCPQTFYNLVDSNNLTICENCIAPCLNCNSNISCSSCISGLFLYLDQCVNICPNYTITNQNASKCDACLNPCLTCENETYFCLSCIETYYYQKQLLRCYLPKDCPVPITVANNTSQTCDMCESPCLTCQNLTNFCLSCISNYYLNSSNSCVNTCSSGFYGSLGICMSCQSPCLACISQIKCLSCIQNFYLYQNNLNQSIQCLSACPANFNLIVNNSCLACQQYCVNCSSTNICYQCSANAILYKQNCIQSCPSNLIYYHNTSNNKIQCVTQNELAQKNLSESLSLISILPLPFLIFGSIFFIAGLMSKLQNKDTWIIGWGYVVFGVIQAGSLAYLLFIYFNNYQNSKSQGILLLYMLIGVIGFLIFLNFLSLTCMTPFLSQDQKFSKWISISSKQSKQKLSQESLSIQTAQNETQESDLICCENSTSFIIFTILAFLISYKIKIIFFTKLFQFSCMSATLQNIQKFSMFNIFSFLGVLQQGVAIYIFYRILTSYQTSSVLFLPTLDCLIITIICIILTMISINKEEDFFKSLKNKENNSHDKLIDNFRKKDKLVKKNFKITNQTQLQGLGSNHVLKQQQQEQNSDFNIQQEKNEIRNNNQSRKPFYIKSSKNKVQNIFIEQEKQKDNFSTLKKSKTMKDNLISSIVKKHPSTFKSPNTNFKLKSTFKQQKNQEINQFNTLSPQNKFNKESKILSPKKKQWVEVGTYQSKLKKQEKLNNLKQSSKFPSSRKQWVEVDSSKKLKQKPLISAKQRVDLFNPYLNPTIESKKNNQNQQNQKKIEQESFMIPSITSKTKKRQKNSRKSTNMIIKDSLSSLDQLNQKKGLIQQQNDDLDKISLTKNNKQLLQSNPQSSFEKGVFYQQDSDKNKSFQPLLPFVHQDGQLKYMQRGNKPSILNTQNKNIFQHDEQEQGQENNSLQISKNNDSVYDKESIQKQRKQDKENQSQIISNNNQQKQKNLKKILEQKQVQFSGRSNIIQKQNYQTINKTLKQLSQQFENNNNQIQCIPNLQDQIKSSEKSLNSNTKNYVPKQQLAIQNQSNHITNQKKEQNLNKENANEQQIQFIQEQKEDENIPSKIKLVHHPSLIFKKGNVDVSEANQYSKLRIANKIEQKQHQLQIMKKSAQKLNQAKQQKRNRTNELKKRENLNKQLLNLRKSRQNVNKLQNKTELFQESLQKNNKNNNTQIKEQKNKKIIQTDNDYQMNEQRQEQIDTKKAIVKQINLQNDIDLGQKIIQRTSDKQNNQVNVLKMQSQNQIFINQSKQQFNALKESNHKFSTNVINQNYQQENNLNSQKINYQKQLNKQNIQSKHKNQSIKSQKSLNHEDNQYVKIYQGNNENKRQQNQSYLITLQGKYNSIQTIHNSQKNQSEIRIKPLNQDINAQSVFYQPIKQKKSQIIFQMPQQKNNDKKKILIDKQQQIPLSLTKKMNQSPTQIILEQDQIKGQTIDQNNKYEALLKLINKNNLHLNNNKKNIPKDQTDQKFNLRIKMQQKDNIKYNLRSTSRHPQLKQQKQQNQQHLQKQIQNNLNEDQNIGKKSSVQKRVVFNSRKEDFEKYKQETQDNLGSKRKVIGNNKTKSTRQINFGSNKLQLLRQKAQRKQQSKVSLHVNRQKLESYLQKDQPKISQQMLHHQLNRIQFDSDAELKQWKNKFLISPQQFVNMKQEYHKNNIPIKPIVYSQNGKTNTFSEQVIEDFQKLNFDSNDNNIYFDYQKNKKQSSIDQIDPYDPQFYYQMLNQKDKRQPSQQKQKSRQKSNNKKNSQEKQKRKKELQKIYRGYCQNQRK